MSFNGSDVPVAKPAPVPPAEVPDVKQQLLLLWSESDSLSIRDAFEGILVLGQWGSGKTSGPGQALCGRS
jgi:hypothetical protein